mmetsp:Transcript_1131/g.3199  ORF Transcript_1131/g.3199 Transcript_1131/m.3199 type:complete len:410 (-) Transcript_1131:2495-3724(-)
MAFGQILILVDALLGEPRGPLDQTFLPHAAEIIEALDFNSDGALHNGVAIVVGTKFESGTCVFATTGLRRRSRSIIGASVLLTTLWWADLNLPALFGDTSSGQQIAKLVIVYLDNVDGETILIAICPMFRDGEKLLCGHEMDALVDNGGRWSLGIGKRYLIIAQDGSALSCGILAVSHETNVEPVEGSESKLFHLGVDFLLIALGREDAVKFKAHGCRRSKFVAFILVAVAVKHDDIARRDGGNIDCSSIESRLGTAINANVALHILHLVEQLPSHGTLNRKFFSEDTCLGLRCFHRRRGSSNPFFGEFRERNQLINGCSAKDLQLVPHALRVGIQLRQLAIAEVVGGGEHDFGIGHNGGSIARQKRVASYMSLLATHTEGHLLTLGCFAAGAGNLAQCVLQHLGFFAP